MKIIARQGNGRVIRIWLPTGLVRNPLAAGIAASQLGKRGVNITRKQIIAMVQGIHCYRKAHPEWVLLEAVDTEGNCAQIKL